MGRPPSKATEVRSRMLHVRLRDAEYAGLQELAAALGQTPSRVLRRLIREALTGGPDYFTDELRGLRGLVRELTAHGRNLNQLARAANRGRVVEAAEVRRVVNAGLVQLAAVKALYDQVLETVVKRAVDPLHSGWPEEKGKG